MCCEDAVSFGICEKPSPIPMVMQPKICGHFSIHMTLSLPKPCSPWEESNLHQFLPTETYLTCCLSVFILTLRMVFMNSFPMNSRSRRQPRAMEPLRTWICLSGKCKLTHKSSLSKPSYFELVLTYIFGIDYIVFFKM